MAERPSLRAEQIEATRRAVIDSARRLFGAEGYAAASIDRIASDARVTKGAVYHHFGSKEGLFRAVYEEVEAEAQMRTAVAVDPNASPLAQIVQGVRAYLDATLDPVVQRITLIDAPAVLGPEPDGPPGEQPGHVGLREFVAQAVAAGEITAVDPDAVVHLLSGACLHAATLIARSPDQTGARRRIGAALEAMIAGLAPAR